MFIENREFLIGADPELFITRKSELKKEKKFFWTAHGVYPGSKYDPFPVKGGAIQVDGCAVEFNINPSKTYKQFYGNIRSVLKEIKKRTPKDMVLCANPEANFEEEYFSKEVPEEAKELGCDPDWNAYTENINASPSTEEPFRTGAGHIHIGFGKNLDINDPTFMEGCFHIIKHMDACVGKPLRQEALDFKRGSLYGDFGAFRPKPYGVEYRTPSNYWLKSPEMIKWIWNATQEAIERAFDYNCYDYNPSNVVPK